MNENLGEPIKRLHLIIQEYLQFSLRAWRSRFFFFFKVSFFASGEGFVGSNLTTTLTRKLSIFLQLKSKSSKRAI